MFGSLNDVKFYVPIVSEIVDSGLDDNRSVQEMVDWLFLTIIMDRLRNFPPFIPFLLLMGIIDILKVFLKYVDFFTRVYDQT